MRRLLATPVFTVFAVLSLAIGAAVTTAVYSIVDSLLLRNSGIRDPEQVVFVVTPYGRAIVLAYLDVEGSVIDPWTLLVAPVPLILAAFWACYLPARRAAGVDPNVALRQE